MDINEFLPPILQPYKAWIALALVINVYFIRPSLPAPVDKSQGWYKFLFNLSDKLAGNYANSAHTLDNLPAGEKPLAVTPVPAAIIPASAPTSVPVATPGV